MKKYCFLLFFIFLAQSSIFAQQPQPTPTPTPSKPEDEVVVINTDLIQLDAVVTDKDGKQVTDLKPEDFEVSQNGVKQKITNFSYVAITPNAALKTPSAANPVPPLRLKPQQVRRTIALVVDDLGLSFESTVHVRYALKKFVDEQMQPDDLVAIIRTAGGAGALQQFTSDKRQLYAAIEKVRWNQTGHGRVSAFEPLGGSPGDFRSATPQGVADDAAPTNAAIASTQSIGREIEQFREDVFAVGTLGALNFTVKGMRELPGRKAVVLFSDGFRLFTRSQDTPSAARSRIVDALRRLDDLANRASVVINTVDARGLFNNNLTAADNPTNSSSDKIRQQILARGDELHDTQEGLIYLAAQTGGRSFINNNDIKGSITKVLEDQQGYYLIGYVPADETFDASKKPFNKLIIQVLRPDLKIRYRSGFYGVADENNDTPKATERNEMYKALTSPFASGAIELRLASVFGNNAENGSFMRSFVYVKGGDLTFVEDKDGWSKTTFDVIAMTFGDNGDVVDEVNRIETIRARTDTLAAIKKDGLVYTVFVPVKKPGAYQMRVALRDTTTAKIGSANQFIEVPNLKNNRLALSGIALDNFELKADKSAESQSDMPMDTAQRRFKRGTALRFLLMIYNARIDSAMRRPNLAVDFKIFRDNREIYDSKENPIELAGQTDFERILAGDAFVLGQIMIAGEYVLQVNVRDRAAKEGQSTATQLIDFEITN